MEIRIFDTQEEIGAAAGKIICEFTKNNPDCVLGFATGASPVPTYNYMIKQYENGEVSFENIKTFNLDEYCDLPRSHKNSYYTFMHENLFDKIDVKEENIGFLDGNAEEKAESKRYTEAIKAAGGIDIQILGIGRNGHIAFNEPSDEFTGESYKVELTQSTIDANSIYFDDIAMPHYAMTMGIGLIMESKKIVLIATGDKKAQAVYDMVNGPVTPKCPASILQQHSDVVILLDKEAAQKII
ncbi:MAG: glucosamine-6-phosphate deaminase [Clostridiales bacterium]|nr:glucosamine-6-phosphate deaminase [Clostridiales bacterium]